MCERITTFKALETYPQIPRRKLHLCRLRISSLLSVILILCYAEESNGRLRAEA